MTHDTEAAWPLTQPDQGYYPSPSPTAPIPPSILVPTSNTPPQTWRAPTPSTPSRQMPWGVKIAMLAMILFTSVVLTGLSMSGAWGDEIIALIVVWVGIVLVTTIVFSNRNK